MENIRPIRSEADYDWALAEISHYFENEPKRGTPEADRFDVLAALIGAYEDEVWPIEAPNPVETIKAFMIETKRSQADLAKLLDSKSRASEVLNYKRALSIQMVHRLSSEWHIPAETLIKPYHLVKDGPSKSRRAQAK